MKNFQYEIYGERYTFSSVYSGGLWDEQLAEDAAEDYHSNHDGWENRWPLTITLFEEEGREIGKYSVDIESAPAFVAVRYKRAAR